VNGAKEEKVNGARVGERRKRAETENTLFRPAKRN